MIPIHLLRLVTHLSFFYGSFMIFLKILHFGMVNM